MKVSLVFPRFKYPTGDLPLGIAYIASYIREKFPEIQVNVLDTTFNPSFDFVVKFFKKERPAVTGIYMSTPMYNEALAIAKIAKKFSSNVIIGGPHATVAPESVILNPNVDAVCIGEGEKTFSEYVNTLLKGKDLRNVKGIWYKEGNEIRINNYRPPIKNLDLLPFPARDLFDVNKYMKLWFQLDSVSPNLRGFNLIASRGCPFHCTYCQPTLNKIFGNMVRKRSPKNIVDELEFLVKKYKINAFMFQDDTFSIDKEWVIAICDEIKNRKLRLVWGANVRADTVDYNLLLTMKKTGLRKICIGVESASQRILDDIYKKEIKLEEIKNTIKIAKSLGLNVRAYFMIGAPTETRKEIFKTIAFATLTNSDEATFTIVTPYPSTYLEEIAIKNGWRLLNDFSKFYYFKNESSILPNYKKWEISLYKNFAHICFYFSPKRWLPLIRSVYGLNALRKTYLKIKRFS